MPRELKTRWFHPVHVNCDCASYDHVFFRAPHAFEFFRCIFCKKPLGDMEIRWYGKFRAKTLDEAWAQVKKR